jgi:hypothetical protein
MEHRLILIERKVDGLAEILRSLSALVEKFVERPMTLVDGKLDALERRIDIALERARGLTGNNADQEHYMAKSLSENRCGS